MRANSTPSLQKPSPHLSLGSSRANTPRNSSFASTSSPAVESVPVSSPTSPAPAHVTLATTTSFCTTTPSHTPQVEDLLRQNSELKKALSELQDRMNSVLDHSIQSDQRLLQFTNDIFVVNNGSAQAHQATQTDPSIDIAPKQSCSRCIIYYEESQNMIASIKTLEEEIRQLKQENNSCAVTSQGSKHSKSSKTTFKLSNRFEPLNTVCELQSDGFTEVSCKKEKRNIYRNPQKPHSLSKKNKSNSKQKNSQYSKVQRTKNINTVFKDILVTGDSHVRHLASVMKERTSRDTKIFGMCKPGAGLMNVASSSTPDSPPDCVVLMAGTNDVAAGRQDIFLRNFESVLKNYSKTSSVLACALPPRHDLPLSSPIHHVVARLNAYISELCVRNKGVAMLNIDSISRHHYTSHGMHLRASGKRLLANLILERLSCLPAPCRTPQLPAATSNIGPAPASPEVITLPYDSYAEAVLQPPSQRSHRDSISGYSTCLTPPRTHISGEVLNGSFLGSHLLASKQK